MTVRIRKLSAITASPALRTWSHRILDKEWFILCGLHQIADLEGESFLAPSGKLTDDEERAGDARIGTTT
jgi:hypothetical protein